MLQGNNSTVASLGSVNECCSPRKWFALLQNLLTKKCPGFEILLETDLFQYVARLWIVLVRRTEDTKNDWGWI